MKHSPIYIVILMGALLTFSAWAEPPSEIEVPGILFLNGEYVSPPYEFKKEANKLFVNGRLISTVRPPMKAPAGPAESEPQAPVGLKKSDTTENQELGEYLYQLASYCYSQIKPFAKAHEYFRKKALALPPVKEVKIGEEKDTVEITLHEDIAIYSFDTVFIHYPDREAKDVEKDLTYDKDKILKALRKGGWIYEFPSQRSGTPPDIWIRGRDLQSKGVPLFKILMSDENTAVKLDAIVAMGLTPYKHGTPNFLSQRVRIQKRYKGFFEAFRKPPSEFNEHLKQLLKWKDSKQNLKPEQDRSAEAGQ